MLFVSKNLRVKPDFLNFFNNCLISDTNGYFRLQYFTSLALLLFTHYLKLSSWNRFPVQVSAFQLSVHHQNLFSFRQLLPWAGSAKSMNNL